MVDRFVAAGDARWVDMNDRYHAEEKHRLAAEARKRAMRCPATLDDWEERVAERWRRDTDVLTAIQVIDLDFRSGRLREADAIALLQRIEESAEDGSGRCHSPMAQPWFFSSKD